MAQDLITTLIAQHNELRTQMQRLDSLALPGKEAADEIVPALAVFKQALLAHLSLENTQFYPVVLEKFKDNKPETETLHRFIEEMKNIEKAVLVFLGKYGAQEAVVSDSARFRTDLKVMISTLMIRISAEEDGVYLYW
jgi:regulator of sigma D